MRFIARSLYEVEAFRAFRKADGSRATRREEFFFLLGQCRYRDFLHQVEVFEHFHGYTKLTFAAIIPKGEFATLVLLGDEIDKELVGRFLAAPEVVRCFPEGIDIPNCFDCQCYPKINVRAAVRPYADRLVLIGDVASTKLYKNGIGAAYIAAKSAAAAAIFDGISERAFAKNYGSTCADIEKDNGLGRMVFGATGLVKKLGFVKQAFLRVILSEQKREGRDRRLSAVMWDTFTGSATYRDILRRIVNPRLLAEIIKEIVMGLFRRSKVHAEKQTAVESGALGKVYEDGEVIVRQGEAGQSMYVIQQGEVQVSRETSGKDIPIAVLTEGGFFGEMSLFEKDVRSSTVRALGQATVLTVDQHTLLHQVTANPSLAIHLIKEMSARIRILTQKHARVLQDDRRDWANRPSAWDKE